MIHSARDLTEGLVLEADVCIVGAGAAGIALALELSGNGVRSGAGALEVLLLESGGLEEDAATQALYEGEVADTRLHSPPDRYRQRRFGGSTTIWGGRCMPFDPIDFEPRDYVAHSGWPIGIDALSPYYPAANRLCEAGEYLYRMDEAVPGAGPMMDGFVSTHFTTDTIERFSCPTDFGARYGHKLRAARNVRVVLHANVTAIDLDASGAAVESVQVRTLEGRRLKARARRFVLAAGGLEVARLLLASRDRHPEGIGNRHDVVGRYYMCHLAGTIGSLRFDGPLSAVHHGYDVSEEGIYCRRRIALTAQTQRALSLGNFIARLHHPRITDPAHRNAVLSLLFLAKLFIPYEYAKRLYGEQKTPLADWARHAGNVASAPWDAVAFAWHMLRDRKLAARKFPSIIIRSRANLYSLDFHAEQQPNPESRLTLTDRLDALQVPQLRVDWRYTQADVDTVRRALALLAQDIGASGIGRFEFDPEQVELEMTRYGAYGGHHIGTARMGTDPRTSVVDADCRVHEVGNLFIASAAVFPTSSQANPTLTIVALALRLAAHLKAAALRDAAPATSLGTMPAPPVPAGAAVPQT
jgi:choline dehydrogenase-like flavoprotein